MSDVCYKPAAMITPELLASKRQLFEEMQNSVCSVLARQKHHLNVLQTHDGSLPYKISAPVPPVRRGYEVDPAWLVRQVPDKKPELDKRGRQLAGIEPYASLKDLYEQAAQIQPEQPKEDRERKDFFD